MKRYELTKEQWERIKPLLPPEETGKRGPLPGGHSAKKMAICSMIITGNAGSGLPEGKQGSPRRMSFMPGTKPPEKGKAAGAVKVYAQINLQIS